MIVNPFIKKPENLKWLEDNEETFIRYVGEHHSIFDIAHTILHLDTMDDAFVESVKKYTEIQEKRIAKEAAQRKKARGKAATPAPTAIEKKIKTFEDAAKKIEDEKHGDYLLDDDDDLI
jgi:hypothetical protein